MNFQRFVICLNNEGYSASLELHKVYGMMEPLTGDPHDYIRITDESGEDYLYPANWFEEVMLGAVVEAKILASASA